MIEKKIDWNNVEQFKYCIYFDFYEKKIRQVSSYKSLGQVYCLDPDFKEKALEKIGEDKLVKLFTYERN